MTDFLKLLFPKTNIRRQNYSTDLIPHGSHTIPHNTVFDANLGAVYLSVMHFGFFIAPGHTETVAQRLVPLMEDLRGQIDVLIFDWQKELEHGQFVLFVDIEGSALTDEHPETGASLDLAEFTLAGGVIAGPFEDGFVPIRVGEETENYPAGCILGPAGEDTELTHAAAVKAVKNLSGWLIIGQCLCWRGSA